MSGLLGGAKKSNSLADAERKAKEAEKKKIEEEARLKKDEEYRALKQRGKASTILIKRSSGSTNDNTRTTLGG